jgi:O-acetyl-ADP-ribose deacetylase (regulator of RNase III)
MPKGKIKLLLGDITKFEGDAIVNAANESLLGGGGVDGAIHRAAGPMLLAVCKNMGGCKPGMAKITPGFNLPAKHIIHTVGPRYRSDANPPETLRSCYAESLMLASLNNCNTVAFPAIGTGIFGYPLKQATRIAVQCVQTFTNDLPELEVTFICFDQKTLDAYDTELDKLGR